MFDLKILVILTYFVFLGFPYFVFLDLNLTEAGLRSPNFIP